MVIAETYAIEVTRNQQLSGHFKIAMSEVCSVHALSVQTSVGINSLFPIAADKFTQIQMCYVPIGWQSVLL